MSSFIHHYNPCHVKVQGFMWSALHLIAEISGPAHSISTSSSHHSQLAAMVYTPAEKAINQQVTFWSNPMRVQTAKGQQIQNLAGVLKSLSGLEKKAFVED
eukprot:1916574-Amphidinium_carterae.2